MFACFKSYHCLILAVLLFSGLPLFSAQEISHTYTHSLESGAVSQSFEHLIKLPEELSAQRYSFTDRSLSLTGDLVIVEEKLLPNSYYIKVRLVTSSLRDVQGTIKICLKHDAKANLYSTPKIPQKLSVIPASFPRFYWIGDSTATAVELTDMTSNQVIWQRIILGKNACQMDETGINPEHRYVVCARSINSNGRKSVAAYCTFQGNPFKNRKLFEGKIKSIIMAGEDDPADIVGAITIVNEDNAQMSFQVHQYSLILVEDGGYIYAGELHQIRPGWECSVGYDIPEDDDWWNTDSVDPTIEQTNRWDSDNIDPTLKYVDNMIVHYPGNGNSNNTNPDPPENSNCENRFSRDENGIVTDTQTGLQWLEGPEQPTSWKQAQAWIASLGNRWRTPTIKELSALYLPDSKRKGIYGDPLCIDKAFIAESAYSRWSIGDLDENKAWMYDFSRGYAHWFDTSIPGHYDQAIAVREKSPSVRGILHTIHSAKD